jgi:opacity protein-like surface antigen
VRGRLGYATNNVLVYGTGGWAWGHGRNTTQINCIGPACPGTSAVPPTSPVPASVDVQSSGWSAGGGIDWAIGPVVNVSGRMAFRRNLPHLPSWCLHGFHRERNFGAIVTVCCHDC